MTLVSSTMSGLERGGHVDPERGRRPVERDAVGDAASLGERSEHVGQRCIGQVGPERDERGGERGIDPQDAAGRGALELEPIERNRERVGHALDRPIRLADRPRWQIRELGHLDADVGRRPIRRLVRLRSRPRAGVRPANVPSAAASMRSSADRV